MSIQDPLPFAFVLYALVVVSPGPAFLFMTKVGLQERTGVAFCSMFGYVCGATANSALAMFGIGGLVESHKSIGFFVSLFGAAFLFWLAAGSVRKAYAERSENTKESAKKRTDKRTYVSSAMTDGKSVRSLWSGLRSGLAISLSNPKAIAFFVAVFAPLVAGFPASNKGLLLLFGFSVKFLWYGSVVFFFKQARVQRSYRRNIVLYDVLLGIVLAGVGVLVLFEATHYAADLF